MQLSDFSYSLPQELIADYPALERSGSKLLCLNKNSGEIQHRLFRQIVEFLQPADLLIFNDTRVIPARLYGTKETGGKVEALIERMTGDRQFVAQLKASKSPSPGSRIDFGDAVQATVRDKKNGFYTLDCSCSGSLVERLEAIGHMPLPPYIHRQDEAVDQERYQTVYGKKKGAVAAPTAGLHFDAQLLSALDAAGVNTGFVTLHVGAGTFQPVRTADILAHQMHSEYVEVSAEICEKVQKCRRQGGRVFAVGTTSVRSLETAALGGELQPFNGETDIFIYPGFEFKVVDALITNFHLPESTLLMLVSAFADRELILNAYQLAIAEKYRFFSYGDAMLIYSGIQR